MEITIKFGRTTRPAEYQSASAEAIITHEVDGPDIENLTQVLRNLYLEAKSAVLEQLDLDFTVDPNGVALEDAPQSPEQVAQAFGGQVVPMPQPVPPAGQPQPVPMATGPTPACAKCGGEQWDNRADNARRRAGGYKLGPDFKCKVDSNHVTWPDDYSQYKHLPKEPR